MSLAIGVFSLIMAEFLPASLLPAIADDLGVTAGAAGQTVTATAIAGAISGIFLPVVLPNMDRRRLLLCLTALAMTSSLIVASAPSLTVVLAARLLLGVALGGFWTLAIAMTAQIVSDRQLGRAVTIINIGVSLATVAAIPLGTWLSQDWGWRGVFVLSAGISGLALAVQAAALPRVRAASTRGLRALVEALRSRVLVLGLSSIAIITIGHFMGFTYIRPAAESVSDIDAGGLAAVLFVYGLANLFGTAASGFLVDRSIQASAMLFPAVLGAGMLVLVLGGGAIASIFVAGALWGFGFGGVPTTAQTWCARAEPSMLEPVGGLLVSSFQVTIASGAVVGGVLVDQLAPIAPLAIGGVVTAVGGIALACVPIRRPAAARDDQPECKESQ